MTQTETVADAHAVWSYDLSQLQAKPCFAKVEGKTMAPVKFRKDDGHWELSGVEGIDLAIYWQQRDY